MPSRRKLAAQVKLYTMFLERFLSIHRSCNVDNVISKREQSCRSTSPLLFLEVAFWRCIHEEEYAGTCPAAFGKCDNDSKIKKSEVLSRTTLVHSATLISIFCSRQPDINNITVQG